jgi:hypothetical protein
MSIWTAGHALFHDVTRIDRPARFFSEGVAEGTRKSRQSTDTVLPMFGHFIYILMTALAAAALVTVVRRYEPNWLLSYSLVSLILLVAAFAITDKLGW